MKGKATDEEKIAKKISDIISDIRIDLEQVGRYLVRDNPNSTYRRLDIIICSADEEKEKQNGRTEPDYF